MNVAIIFGILFGVGLAALIRGAFAPQPTLRELADEQYRQTLREAETGDLNSKARNRVLLLFPPDKLGKDLRPALRLTNTTPEEHVLQKFGFGAGGFILPWVLWLVAGAYGFGAPALVPFLGAIAFAFIGFLFPDYAIRDNAQARREEFIAALAQFLNLSAILVGASGGPESALARAAEQGDGWPFQELRFAIQLAQGDASMTYWDTFVLLGEELDIRELREFGSSMNMNATAETIGETLRARADNLTNKTMSSIEGDAEEATDRMGVPVSLLTAALMLYIMYGALGSLGDLGSSGIIGG